MPPLSSIVHKFSWPACANPESTRMVRVPSVIIRLPRSRLPGLDFQLRPSADVQNVCTVACVVTSQVSCSAIRSRSEMRLTDMDEAMPEVVSGTTSRVQVLPSWDHHRDGVFEPGPPH